MKLYPAEVRISRQVPFDAYAPPLQRKLTHALLRVFGRPVRCEVCGAVLFRTVPTVWRGRLKLLGAEREFVQADWDKVNRLVFRHVEADRCRASTR